MPEPEIDFSTLLWVLGVVVASLALHLSQGWVRMAQRGSVLRQEWRSLLMAAAALGAGVSAALVLGLQAQELPFPLGYQWLFAAALLLGVVLASAPVVTLVAYRGHAVVCAVAALLLSVMVMGLQAGWVAAAGFRPGVPWRQDLLALAALVLMTGLSVAFWLGGSESTQLSDRRTLWRLAGGLLSGLTLMTGQEIMMMAAGLGLQKGSLYASQLPGTVLSLLLGVVLPLVLVALTLDLWWLRKVRRHRRSHREFNPAQRVKRSHKVRTL